MKKLLILFNIFITIFYISHALAENEKSEKRTFISEKVGDMDFYYQADGGCKLSVFEISIIKDSSLWIMNPKWTDRIYGFPDNPKMIEKATIEDYLGGKKITITHKLPPDKAAKLNGTETFILLPNNSIIISLDFTLKTNSPAIFEWKVASIAASTIFGRPITISDPKKTQRTILPIEAKSPILEESIITKGFDKIVIDSLLGDIEIVSQSDNNIAFIDYRKNKWARADEPIYWMGILDREIESEKKYNYTIGFKFPEKLETKNTTNEVKEIFVNLKKTDSAQIPNWGQNYIIPKPKELKYTNTIFSLTSDIKIYIGKEPKEGILNALDFFLKDLEDFYKLKLEIIKDEPPIQTTNKYIILGETSRFQKPSQICAAANLFVPDNDEGYSILVNDKISCVAAKTEKGVFYGLTTLLQLIAISEKGIYFKGAEIIDYPSLKFRGIHCLSAKNGGDEISKAIRTLMARFKINSLVWECEYIIWDSAPELEHKDYGMTKIEAKKVIDACRKYFIELIPLVQSLGHSEWIFTNKNNLDIAEDPENPYAYNPTNLDTYKFIFKVYQEAVDFFKPKIFHIGHDEVTTSASRFPYRSKNSGKTVTELILDDIHKLYKWFSEKDLKVMLWGDMFLYSEEASGAAFAPTLEDAKKRRALLPKDCIIADWHYEAAKPDEFKSLKIWKNEELKTIGAGWYLPINIYNFTKACIDNNIEGYLQTTWAGFNFKITDNKSAWYQYWAYIWAAHYSWSGDTTSPNDLPFVASEKFINLWFECKPVLHKKEGLLFDLSSLYNRKLSDDESKTGWLGYGADLDYKTFPIDENVFGETKFLINKNQKDESAIFLAGKLNPKGDYPKSIDININETNISELHFLITSLFNAKDKTKIGNISIKFSDNTVENVDLIYGENIFAFNDGRMGANSRIAWAGKTKLGGNIYASDLTWKNSKPLIKIKGLSISSNMKESSPIIFGITGVK